MFALYSILASTTAASDRRPGVGAERTAGRWVLILLRWPRRDLLENLLLLKNLKEQTTVSLLPQFSCAGKFTGFAAGQARA